MTRRPCSGLAELRSALVDDALNHTDRERVLTHLVSCDSCRLEVEDLRRVRELLNRTRVQTAAPYDLSHRLVSIAGADAQAPLWTRPFRRTRHGELPSARRLVGVRTAAVVVAVGALVATVGGVGYAAAPASSLSAIADPSAEARTEFAAAVAERPLGDDAVSAVLMAPHGSLIVPDGLLVAAPAGNPLDRAATPTPQAVLRRAAEAAEVLSYRGTTSVAARAGADTIAATVTVDQTEQGRQVDVYDRSGRPIRTDFSSGGKAPRIGDEDDLLDLLLDGYEMSAWGGARVAGRDATVVEATSGRGVDQPVRAARWWFDDVTGLLLWQETYDPDGTVILSAGFTSVTMGSSGFLAHLAPKLGAPSTTASLTLSSAGSLSDDGWACDDDLAGLSLVRLRTAEGSDPDVLHLVYSDGLETVSVVEQRGALAAPPADSTYDAGVGAYVQVDSSRQATWQSGGTVFTVVSDGSADLLRRAVAALPHERPRSRTTMERIQAGWTRILHSLIG